MGSCGSIRIAVGITGHLCAWGWLPTQPSRSSQGLGALALKPAMRRKARRLTPHLTAINPLTLFSTYSGVA